MTPGIAPRAESKDYPTCLRSTKTAGQCGRNSTAGPRRGWRGPAGCGALVRVGQGYLDAADQVGALVVDEDPDRGQGGEQNHIDQADDRGVSEDGTGVDQGRGPRAVIGDH